MNDSKRVQDDTAKAGHDSPVEAAVEAPRPPRRPRVTPMPMNQMLPMTFVLLNESLCGTMLLPFVGLLVAHLNKIPVEEAGYQSGMLISMFMLGQMVSAKPWGWMSDKYGRRFPIISGLFTSGLMMLGFGLSSSVWMCATFRFFHGLFNGNILVAKTMMADITDRTNQAKGFAFVSLCYGIGVLIGPTLGGLLYDPANSSALRWAHIGKDSIFSRYPAFLPSLVIFVYTNIGMVICTFFVMESNPHAQPLPGFVRYVYPCFWREPKLFVHPSAKAGEEGETGASAAGSSDDGRGDDDSDGESDDRMSLSIRTAEGLVANVSMTRPVASLLIASPVRHEGRRFDHLVAAENLTTATPRASAVTPRYGQSTLPRLLEGQLSPPHGKSSGSDDGDANVPPSVRKAAGSAPCTATDAPTAAAAAALDRKTAAEAAREVSANLSSTADPARAMHQKGVSPNTTLKDKDTEGGLVVVADAENAREEADNTVVVNAVAVPAGEAEEAVLKRFGYRQAFERPVTRTMLIFYMLLSVADMSVQEIIPLWAIAPTSVGGLGFGADKVSYIILTNSFPCVSANLLFHRACMQYENKLSLYRLSLACCAISIVILPFISYVDLGHFLFITIVLCTGVRQFFASWCYGLVTMLTARSAPNGHVGSIMGINQSCGALARTVTPFVITPLFAWSITSHHPFPFDHCFVFMLSGIIFSIGYVYSEWLRTSADAKPEMNTETPAWMTKVKDVATVCYTKLCGGNRNEVVVESSR